MLVEDDGPKYCSPSLIQASEKGIDLLPLVSFLPSGLIVSSLPAYAMPCMHETREGRATATMGKEAEYPKPVFLNATL